jgi:hypothetical protein
MRKKNVNSIVRRVQPRDTDLANGGSISLTHGEAFDQAYGRHTHRIRQGEIGSRETDAAAIRAAACIAACEDLPSSGLQEGGVRELIEAARAAKSLLSGRLIRIDPEASIVLSQVSRALKKLGI